MKGKPVPGWEAKPVKGKKGHFDTFEVKRCPDYVRQKEKVRYCKVCGRKLLVMQKEYCGETCAKEAQKRRYMAGKPIKKCIICGKELPKNKQKFCSEECYRISFNKDNQKRYRKKTSESF